MDVVDVGKLWYWGLNELGVGENVSFFVWVGVVVVGEKGWLGNLLCVDFSISKVWEFVEGIMRFVILVKGSSWSLLYLFCY